MTKHKNDDLSPAQKNFISRRMVSDTKSQVNDYIEGHKRALASRFRVGSPRYFQSITEHLDGPQKPTERPAQPRPRYDGASAPMPKLRGEKDEFHALRNKATSNGRYGKK